MTDPSFNQEEALLIQRKMLREKQKHSKKMLQTIDKTLQHIRRERNMSKKERFSGFDFTRNPYEQEARERWGNQAVEESKDKIDKITKEEGKDIDKELDVIYNN